MNGSFIIYKEYTFWSSLGHQLLALMVDTQPSNFAFYTLQIHAEVVASFIRLTSPLIPFIFMLGFSSEVGFQTGHAMTCLGRRRQKKQTFKPV